MAPWGAGKGWRHIPLHPSPQHRPHARRYGASGRVEGKVKVTHPVREEVVIWPRGGEESLLLEAEAHGLGPRHLTQMAVVVGSAQAVLHHL